MSPTIGRNIRYVLATGPNAGQARLAFVTNVIDGDRISLTCLPDAAVDRIGVTYTATNARFSETKEHGTWHWPSVTQP
ncbi:MAG: hypothetical protein ACOYM3_15655 [Terrimicrobiaceae bacterium]